MKNNVINENEMENVNGGGSWVKLLKAKEVIMRERNEDSADKQDD